MFGLIAVEVLGAMAAFKEREEWLNSMPKDEADKIRAEYARLEREKEMHRRAVEIAEAGRPRNFWGK